MIRSCGVSSGSGMGLHRSRIKGWVRVSLGVICRLWLIERIGLGRVVRCWRISADEGSARMML